MVIMPVNIHYLLESSVTHIHEITPGCSPDAVAKPNRLCLSLRINLAGSARSSRASARFWDCAWPRRELGGGKVIGAAAPSAVPQMPHLPLMSAPLWSKVYNIDVALGAAAIRG